MQDATSGKSVVGLASMLGVSFESMAKVQKASKRGSLTSSMLDSAQTTTTKARDQPEFLKRVTSTLTPIVEQVCSYPKFADGKSDPGGVASMILGKIARAKSAKCKRKLKYDRPKGVSVELDAVLKEFGEAWRTVRRNQDRDASARVLQLALKAIPPRKGRVTDWLGPRYK